MRDVDTTTRLRLYEDTLRKLGIDPEELVRQHHMKGFVRQNNPGTADLLQPHIPQQANKGLISPENGVLVSEDWWKTRYLENGLWTSLKGEFRESEDILDDSSDEESLECHNKASPNPLTPESANLLLFDVRTRTNNLRALHPQPVQIFKLWQSYLDNINPLVKLFHAPSVQHFISNASGHMEDIPKSVEALMFAIYCITVESLSDADCIGMLGEAKIVARQRFRSGAQHALINASFLKTSDMMVLKALTLFIVSLQYLQRRPTA